MSESLIDRISREHEITVEPTMATESGRELYHCACNVRTERGVRALLSDEQYHEHLIEVTEAAVRQQLAAEVWALEHDADAMRREVWAGKSIAWVEGWDAAVLTAGRIVHGEPILAAGGEA